MLRDTFPVGLLACNCSILGDEATGDAVVIDPGDNVPEIMARLAKHRLTLRQIIITHAHIDHVGGAAELKELTGAPVIMHGDDLELLQMMDRQAEWLGVSPPRSFVPEMDARDQPQTGLPATPAKILHTPGHTPGSICLLIPAQKLLLAGDTLFAGSIGRTDLPGGDRYKILQSLRNRLLILPDDVHVVPGHGPETTIGNERESNPFLRA